MALKIKANSAFESRSLTVDSQGVRFTQTAFVGGRRRFRFDQIDWILMSPSNVLSFQVGNEMCSIPTKPDNRRHQETIQALLHHVQASS